MSELSKKILNQINESAITPTERWKFLLKRFLVWVVAGVVSILASFALALTTHVLFEIDWSVYQELGFTWYEILQSLSPPVWTFCLAALMITGVILLRRTKRGYRYSLPSMLSILFFSGIAMAATFEQWPNEEHIESSLMYKIPGYRNFEARILPSVEKQWSQPDDGLLGGTIMNVERGESFEIRDFKDKTWTVDASEAAIGESVELEKDQDIKIIGEPEDDDRFRATEVRPWKPASSNSSSGSTTNIKLKKESEDEKEEIEDKKKSKEHQEDEEQIEDEHEDEEDEEEEEVEHEDEDDDEDSGEEDD